MRFMVFAVASAYLSTPGMADENSWHADAVARAMEFYSNNQPDDCVPFTQDGFDPASFELQIGEETAARQALIVEFPCQIGAYNQTATFLLSDQHGKVSEIVFPSPQVDVTYLDDDDARVDKITITQTPLLREVVNANYDPSSRTMTERNKWRGLGDAYSETRWGFKHGKFEIMYFAVDASYDGKDNSQVLIDKDIW